jgi:hypothetical protein
LSLQHLLLFIGTFEDVQVDVGVWVGVSNLCESPPLRCPLGHVWVSIAFFLFPLILPLPHLRRRLCVCACIRLDMLSLSLSLSLSLPLSHYYILTPLYISLSSLRVSPRMSLAKNLRQVQR